jgi:NADH-quinone oxidoreductase subunit N
VIALGAAATISAIQFDDTARFAFDHTLRIDAFGQGGRMLIFLSGLLAVCVAFGMRDLRERGVEYHALLLSACAGMSLLAVANSFVTTFVALELFSICLYVLVAIETDDLLSLEGGLKYLIVGSVGAAFLLYGGALAYGATGELEFDRMARVLSHGDPHGVLLLAGIAFVVVGLAFKANAAPFHMWTPDAYEGAPTPVTTFMSAATKVVALVIALRVLVTAFPRQSDVWEIGLAGIVIACFIAGNLGALRQTNVKRLLAYSTVAHSGFLLTAVAAHSALGGRALVYYLTIYAAMNVGAFAIVAIREREIGRPVEVSDFAGWGYRRPLLSIAMVVFMLSLAGFPPTGGFLGKLYIWSAAVANGQTYLAIAGAIATVVGLVYYLRVPFALFDRDAAVPAAARPANFPLDAGVAIATALVVLGFGIIPSPLIDLARTASSSLFG